VILEEMAMYHDDPEESMHDLFDSIVFAGHSLGMNTLGRKETVSSFGQQDFKKFIAENLDTNRIVFSVVGNVSFEKVVAIAEKYLAPVPKTTGQSKREKFKTYKAKEVSLKKNIKQSRCAIGRPAFHIKHEKRSAFYMLTNILGGGGMNSRLNLALREKYGFVYNIGAQYIPFTDTGLFVISFGTEPSQLKKSIELVKLEMQKLRDDKLGVKQLAAAKEQILGQIAMAEESNISFMIMMGRNLLDHGRVTTLDEIFERVKNTSASDLQELANEMYVEKKMSVLMVQP
jgi:predicted Zn-dependent peptidase